MVTPIEKRVTRSVKVSIDEALFAPMIWSPSQWPSSLRSPDGCRTRRDVGQARALGLVASLSAAPSRAPGSEAIGGLDI
jgi:hypothetical protein